jgi:hypothetical protein
MWTFVKRGRKYRTRVEANRRSVKVKSSSPWKNWIYHSNWTVSLIRWWRKNVSIVRIRRIISLNSWAWTVFEDIKYKITQWNVN